MADQPPHDPHRALWELIRDLPTEAAQEAALRRLMEARVQAEEEGRRP